jgi:hypothetical protein
MQANKYEDLVVLLLLLDQVELRARELAEWFPELHPMADAISEAADIWDLMTTVEEETES